MPLIPDHLRRRRQDELDARRTRGEPTWEPLDGEPARAYQWFLAFLQERDFERTARRLGVTVTQLHDASQRWCWAERMRDFQRHLAQRLVEVSEYELAETLAVAVELVRRTMLDSNAPAQVRLRAAELALRYSALGRTPARASPDASATELADDPLAMQILAVQQTALERLRNQKNPEESDGTITMLRTAETA